jgi:oligosaccharide repeat unit polymerase
MLESIWIIILFCAGLICTNVWMRFGFQMLSPGGLLCLIWSIIWIIIRSDVFQYINIPDLSINLGCAAVISFCIGEILGFHVRGIMRPTQYNWIQLHQFVRWNLIISSLFTLSLFAAVSVKYGNILNGAVAESLKLQRVQTGTDYIKGTILSPIATYAEPAKVFLYVALFLIIPISVRFRKIAIVMFFSVVVNALIFDVSWGSRTTIFDVVYAIYVILIINSRVVNNPKVKDNIKKYFGLLLVLLIGFADLITALTRPDKKAEIAGVTVPFSFYQFVTYNTSSVVAFAADVEHDKESSYGLLTLTPWIDLLYRLKIYRNDNLFVYEIRNRFERHEGYISEIVETPNTYSWLKYLWVDFGVFGVSIVPFLLGLIGGVAAKTISQARDAPISAYLSITIVYLTVMRSPVIWLLRSEWIQFAPIIIYLFVKRSVLLNAKNRINNT